MDPMLKIEAKITIMLQNLGIKKVGIQKLFKQESRG